MNRESCRNRCPSKIGKPKALRCMPMNIDQELLNAHHWNVLILPPFDVPRNINMLEVSLSIEAIV
jgi:hypothetical protein